MREADGEATSVEGTAGHGFTAMVLAGGFGTRLRSVVGDRAKSMALVDDAPFLDRLLDQLSAAGCRRVILCTGHLGDTIEHEYRSGHDGMAIVCSAEPLPLGTAGALRHALPLLLEPAVLVLNGDSYCDLDLRAFVAFGRAQCPAPALVGVTVADTSRYGSLAVDSDGRVRAFVEKATHAGPGIVNAGIYWLARQHLEHLPSWVCVSLEREVLPRLVDRGLFVWRTAAPFLDIGTPESYAQATSFFADCARRTARDQKGLLVLDRDGTLIEERHYLDDPAGVALLPGVVDGLRAFAANGYELAVVTNQSGIGRGYFDERALDAVHAEVRRQLAEHGIVLHGIWHCPHHPDAACACRKPEPLLLERAMQELGYTPAQCLVVGDKACDIQLGQRLAVRTALVRTGYGLGTERDGMCAPDLVVDNLAQLAELEVIR